MTPSKAEQFNRVQWSAHGTESMVESLFLKFHLPEEGSAFWARYTLRRPLAGHGEPVGCLWGVYTSVTGETVAGCDTHAASDVAAGRDRFFLKIGPGELAMGRASGKVGGRGSKGASIEWDLSFEAGTGCLVHFPLDAMYRLGFPRNKAVSPHVSTRFYGTVKIGGRTLRVDGARGMQGHNWGPTVSDHWIWSHANTFEGRDDVVFEGLSSILRFGPVTLPPLTILYLKAEDRQWLFNGPHQLLMSRSNARDLSWEFAGTDGPVRLEGQVTAVPGLTTGLDYISSDGQTVRVHNSNLADARLSVTGLPGGRLDLVSNRTATIELGGRAATSDVPVAVKG